MTDDRRPQLEDELSASERAALERWQPPGPPLDFAQRIAAAQLRQDAPSAARTSSLRRRAGVLLGGFAAGVVISATATWLLHRAEPRAASPSASPTSGQQLALAHRQTLDVAGRAVAVAEPGAALRWKRQGSSARVEQTAGEVFYRVNPGGPFTVVTAAGEVRVTGTCFRVEVLAMPARQGIVQGLVGAGVGATIAAIAVITVYEGKVEVANGAERREVLAGERATLPAGQPPLVTSVASAAPPTPAVAEVPTPADELPPPAANATREQLLARDKLLRARVAALSQQILHSDTALTSFGGLLPSKDDKDNDSWFNPGHDQLLAFAKECKLQVDYPSTSGEPDQVDAKTANELSLSGPDVTAVNAVFAELRDSWTHHVRELYIEATGDAQGADSLSEKSMAQELQDKAPSGVPHAVQKRVAQERAGLVAAVTDVSKASAYERYFRGLTKLGDETERAIARVIGAPRARALRAHNGGWHMRMSLWGCGEEDTPAAP
jgi:ferric-dicitrate binding protein FerR (iron transport regulator)